MMQDDQQIGGMNQQMITSHASTAAQATYAPRTTATSYRSIVPVGGQHIPQEVMRTVNYAPSPAPSAPPNKKKGFGRKPCNCSKSGCLKLYCECFAAGEFCSGCNCKGCHNDLMHEAERSKAIKQCLDRNVNAFQPKIVSSTRGRSDNDRTHLKGCHCKKSNCLKNYCECYEAKVACTGRCKCQCCRNTEADRAEKSNRAGGSKDALARHPHHANLTPSTGGLSSLAAAAANIVENDLHNASLMTAHDESNAQHNNSTGSSAMGRQVDPKTQPWYYMNDDVVQATTLCLTAQADDLQQKFAELNHNDMADLTPEEEDKIEHAVLREFGRCLLQIINNARQQPTSMGGADFEAVIVTPNDHSLDSL